MTVLLEALAERARIVRRVQLVGVVEVDVDVAWAICRRGLTGKRSIVHRLAVAPGAYTPGPLRDLSGTVGAVIELLGAVQAAIDEVRREIHQQRPIDRVGADQCDVVRAQQLDEGGVTEALVPHLHGVADGPINAAAQPRARLQPEVMSATAGDGLFGVARQKVEEPLELLAVEMEVGRKLPEDRAQLGAES